jgi:hypothetical protein
MGRSGRPRLADGERRTAGQLVVRLNERELKVVTRKARVAGVTPTEWARYAALERDPPRVQVVPELNREAWLELARLAGTVGRAVWRFKPGDEASLGTLVRRVDEELKAVRNLLIGSAE